MTQEVTILQTQFKTHIVSFWGAIALSYLSRVRVRATVKLSAAFFHNESSIAKGRGREGVRKCNSAVSGYAMQYGECLQIRSFINSSLPIWRTIKIT